MVKSVLGCLVLFLVSVLPASSHTTIEADRVILHDGQFFPRYLNAARVLVVEAGQVVTLPETSDFDYIEVREGGTLRASRTRSTFLRVRTLVNLMGGTLDFGTQADPIPFPHKLEIVFPNTPIDTGTDPFQWTHGLLNFGRQTRVGSAKASWTIVTADVPAGATSFTVENGSGWRVGDQVFIPDTRQVSPKVPIRIESPVTVAAISGNTITLSKPLDFEHNSIRKLDGTLVLKPRVANLSRNIILRSESPSGTRGHTVNSGDQATWDIRYNRLEGLGRTRNENLNSTVIDANGNVTVGTNQIARYASHDHHVHGCLTSTCQFVGNALVAVSDGVRSKWGHSTHGTADTTVQDNVAVGFPGAGFVTEDGYEARNVYRRNFAALSMGNGQNPSTKTCPGCEGSGLWARGLHEQVFDGNEGWNNAIGIDLFSMNTINGKYPSVPGGEPDTDLVENRAKPALTKGNIGVSNSLAGHEHWETDFFPVEDTIAAHNGMQQVRLGQSTANNASFTNLTALAKGGITDGLSSAEAYVNGLRIDGGVIEGCFQGFQRGMARSFVDIRNVTVQCVIGFNLWGGLATDGDIVLDNVDFKDLSGFPSKYITLMGDVWQPGQPVPSVMLHRQYLPATNTLFRLENWRGTGQNFLLFQNESKAENSAIPALTYASRLGCPLLNATVGQCWEQLGLAKGRGVVYANEAIELEGVTGGVARATLDAPLGSPVAALTFPNLMAPAIVETVNGQNSVRMHAVMLGDETGSPTDRLLVRVDGGTPELKTRGAGNYAYTVEWRSLLVTQGTHTVTTWRVDASNLPIASSERQFAYCIGDCGAPPPPPPPVEVCGDGIDNDGDGQVDEDPPCTTDPPPTGDVVLISTGGIATASGGNQAARLFDGLPNDWWAPMPAWAQYQLPVPAVLKRYTLQPRGTYGDFSPMEWTVSGSQDGVSFDDLDTRFGEAFDGGEVKTYEVTNTTAYRFYRWTLIKVRGPNQSQVQMREMQLFGVGP